MAYNNNRPSGSYGSQNGYNKTGNSKDKQNRNFQNRNLDTAPKYVGAPYNFVPLNHKVAPYFKEKEQVKKLPAHDAVEDNLLSGEILYHIVPKTPIMIDDGQGNFWKNAYGKEAIPGSSIRGLIRSNVQVLSLASIDNDVDDYALMFRNVASGPKKMKERYGAILGAGMITVDNGKKSQQMSILKNVRAGYVYNENGTYRIYDTCIDRVPMKRQDPNGDVLNYYILNERKLSEAYMECQKNRQVFPYPFFVKNDGYRKKFKTQNLLDQGFEHRPAGIRTQYVGRINKDYIPYAEPCSYEVTGRNITAVDFSGKLTHQGYAVSTGNMNMKKAIYIIPEVDKSKTVRFSGDKYAMPLTIPEKDVQAFQVDMNKRQNTLKTADGKDIKQCFDLPENGKMRPVFYIYSGGHLYFGFTPRLRLFYDHTIKEGLPQEHKSGKMDYAKAMFGYSDTESKSSYKSRVSFSDAVVKFAEDTGKEARFILGEPKPTSYLDYVLPKNGEGVSYNDDNFELRGIKQYWLRKEPEQSNVPEGKDDKDYVCKFHPLSAEKTVFEGKVRYHNLKPEELGLLLWSLRLNDKSWMNMGKAKAFGFGVIQLCVDEVQILNPDKAYGFDELVLNPYRSCSVAEQQKLIAAYKKEISEKAGIADIEAVETIKTFFLMKDPELMPDKEKIRFMTLDNREYQNRTKPLPSVKVVLGLESEQNAKADGMDKYSVNARAFKSARTYETVYTESEVQAKPVESRTLLEIGKTFEAFVNKVQGRQLQFKITVDGNVVYGKFKSDMDKAMLKGFLGKSVKVRCTGHEEGKEVWECVEFK